MASVRKSPTSEGDARWQAVWAERAGAGRKDAATNKKLRKPKGSARARAAHGGEVERRGIGDPAKA